MPSCDNSQQPLVSVCIANYNGVGMIDGCLGSILSQGGNLQFEIIVHDDASSDGSGAHIRSHYPAVKLIESTVNVGFCIANNRMAEVARGEYLLLLNNDAELLPDALLTLCNATHNFAQPAILGLPQYDFDTGDLVDIGSMVDPFLNPVPNRDPERSEVAMVIGACLWIEKSLWQELGGFPEWFGSIAEDMYLCCLARLLGYRVLALPDSGYRHRQGKSFGGNRVAANRLATTCRRRTLSERNKTYVMVLTCPAPVFHLLFPLHLAMLLVEGVVLALIKRNWSLFREVYFATLEGVWRERKRLLQLRHELQSKRRVKRRQFFSVFSLLPHKLRLLLRHGVPQIH